MDKIDLSPFCAVVLTMTPQDKEYTASMEVLTEG